MTSTLFALLLMTPNGQMAEAYTFESMAECQKAITTFSVKGMCVEKRKPDFEKIMRNMGLILKEMDK